MRTKLSTLVLSLLATPLCSAAGPFAQSEGAGPFSNDSHPGFFEPFPQDYSFKAADACTKTSPSGLIWPLCRKVGVTASFNDTTSDDDYPADEQGRDKRHTGTDIASRVGDSVYAPAAGTVRRVSTGASWGRSASGKTLSAVVIVADKAGPLGARFWVIAHIDPAVKEGQIVRAGQKVGTATLASHHHTHVGVGTGTSVPDDRLGRQDESRRDVSPFIDAVEVLSYEWKKEAIAELDRTRKKLKFPAHTREGACSGQLRVSEQCWQRRYDPPGAKSYYTLVADAERRETLYCVKEKRADCLTYDEW
jgi:murein DD-endopeptidase MepM/ murein hydrolase activator NlpD